MHVMPSVMARSCRPPGPRRSRRSPPGAPSQPGAQADRRAAGVPALPAHDAHQRGQVVERGGELGVRPRLGGCGYPVRSGHLAGERCRSPRGCWVELQAARPRPPGGKQPIGPVVSHWGNVRRDLARACELAKVPTVTPNDLRRTFASWLKNQKVDSAVVARLLGHSSTKMVDLVYRQLSAETLADAVAGSSAEKPCAAGERNTSPSGATNDTPGERTRSDPPRSQIDKVPRVGIEPTTRGFSVRCSTN